MCLLKPHITVQRHSFVLPTRAVAGAAIVTVGSCYGGFLRRVLCEACSARLGRNPIQEHAHTHTYTHVSQHHINPNPVLRCCRRSQAGAATGTVQYKQLLLQRSAAFSREMPRCATPLYTNAGRCPIATSRRVLAGTTRDSRLAAHAGADSADRLRTPRPRPRSRCPTGGESAALFGPS